jgi:hypothetical protein
MRSPNPLLAAGAAMAVFFWAVPAFGWLRRHYTDWDVALGRVLDKPILGKEFSFFNISLPMHRLHGAHSHKVI